MWYFGPVIKDFDVSPEAPCFEKKNLDIYISYLAKCERILAKTKGDILLIYNGFIMSLLLLVTKKGFGN